MKLEIHKKGKLSSEVDEIDEVRKVRIELSDGTQFELSECKFGGLVVNKYDSSMYIEPYMSNQVTIK